MLPDDISKSDQSIVIRFDQKVLAVWSKNKGDVGIFSVGVNKFHGSKDVRSRSFKLGPFRRLRLSSLT